MSSKSTQVYHNRVFQLNLNFPLWNATLKNYSRSYLNFSETIEGNMEKTTFLTCQLMNVQFAVHPAHYFRKHFANFENVVF